MAVDGEENQWWCLWDEEASRERRGKTVCDVLLSVLLSLIKTSIFCFFITLITSATCQNLIGPMAQWHHITMALKCCPPKKARSLIGIRRLANTTYSQNTPNAIGETHYYNIILINFPMSRPIPYKTIYLDQVMKPTVNIEL
jgi:hypothetical protein